MANLTIAIDDELLKRARIRALEQGLSVNGLLRDFLESFAGTSDVQRQAIDRLQALADRTESGSGGRRWTRDELYDRGS